MVHIVNYGLRLLIKTDRHRQIDSDIYKQQISRPFEVMILEYKTYKLFNILLQFQNIKRQNHWYVNTILIGKLSVVFVRSIQYFIASFSKLTKR